MNRLRGIDDVNPYGYAGKNIVPTTNLRSNRMNRSLRPPMDRVEPLWICIEKRSFPTQATQKSYFIQSIPSNYSRTASYSGHDEGDNANNNEGNVGNESNNAHNKNNINDNNVNN